MVDLASVVASVESSGDLRAIRFEPLLYVRTVAMNAGQLTTAKRIQSFNRCTLDTARAIYATSYGLYQFLGETLYSAPVNLDCSILDFWADAARQRLAFDTFTRAREIDFSPSDLIANPAAATTFAVRYNGPAHVEDYAAKLVAAAQAQA